MARKKTRKLGVHQLRDAWERYRRGDHIFDDELRLLVNDTRKAIEMLEYRREFGIAHRTLCQDLCTLESFQRARREGKKRAA